MTTTNNSPLTTITDALDAMHANWSYLEHNKLYTLAQLVGNERWLATPKGHRTQLGSLFKAMALSEDLPVRWVNRRDDNSQVYELT